MGRLVEVARARLQRWKDANPQITQRKVAETVGHEQSWVSFYLSGKQNATVDELDAMARAFNHTLAELLDLRPSSKEADLIEAFRELAPERRDFAIEVLRQIAPPKKRGRSRKQNGER
jgi:transcriptional regulator with XRE-family HTH domain